MLLQAKQHYWHFRAALKRPLPELIDDFWFYLRSLLRDPIAYKHASELRYWRKSYGTRGQFSNGHYEYFYTKHFGSSREFFAKKSILDIGCGPSGSLEWADGTLNRIGLDPLALDYKILRGGGHQMKYVAARSEEMPFSDARFDVVASFNSIDHVDDLDLTFREIARVLKPGGFFLLITDVNHPPMPCEPHHISLDVIRAFTPGLVLVEERHFEASVPDNIYASIWKDIRFDAAARPDQAGILTAKFLKPT